MLQVGVASTRTPSSRIRCARGFNFYPAAFLAGVLEPDPERRSAEPPLPRPRPLDEGDAVGTEVVVEQRRVLVLEAPQPVEVEAGDRQPAALGALADRWRALI